MEVAESDVGGGSVAPESVEVSPSDEDELRDAEGGGASSESAHVVPLRYIMHHHVTLYCHFFQRSVT